MRRRHPDQQIEPLRSAEPEGGITHEKERTRSGELWIQPTLDGSVHLPGAGRGDAEVGEQSLAPARRDALGQQALGLTPETVADPIPAQILRIQENMQKAQARIDDLRDTRVPGEDHDAMDLGPAWDVLARRDRDAILQPPKPEITPASEVIRRAQEQAAGYEPEPA